MPVSLPFRSLFTEPPPVMAVELSEAGLAVARLRPKLTLSFHALKTDTISVSPVRDNVLLPDELILAVRELAAADGYRKRRDVALILPDYSTRVAVLDFDSFPSDAREQLSLVRFRMRKSVPFDIEGAALSYYPQSSGGRKCDVVVVVAPVEIVARYEAPFRAAGLNPGLVTTSSLAALNLVQESTTTVLAKLTGRVLTIAVLDKGHLKLVRSLELAAPMISEVAADLFPTFVYVEDQLGAKAERLLLCGFERFPEAQPQFESDLGIAVAPVISPLGPAGEKDAGLLGYLQSVHASVRP